MFKKSIVYKTAFAVSIALGLVMFGVGGLVYSNQSDIINQLQHDKKQTILKYINKAEDDKIKTELNNLESLAKSLSGGLTNSLYNSDVDSAKENIKNLMKNKNIVAVSIYDASVEEMFLVALKNKFGGVNFTTKLPSNISKYKFFKFNMKADGDDIGSFYVYYDTSESIKEIKKLKEQEIIKFNEKVKQIDNQIKEKLINQIIIVSIAGIVVTFLIILLLKKLVNQPLVEFQKGLNSFFAYLKDPLNKVEKITIDTEDEFGQMATSVNENIEISMKMHGEMAQLMLTMDKNVITTETDDKGIITYASAAFCEISGYSKEELIGHPHSMVRHPDMPKEVFKELWDTISAQKTWEGDVKNLKKDGSFYWVHAIISPKCTKSGGSCGYTAVRYDITDKKKVEDLTKNLEIKIAERTKELESEKKLINSIVNSQDSIVITSDGKVLKTINDAFKKFYGLNSIKEFEEKYGPCICDSYEKDVSSEYLRKDMDGTSWVEYVLARPHEIHKVIIKKDDEPHIFSLSLDSFIFEDQKFVTVVLNDITDIENATKQIEAIHKHTKESIEFASLIQSSLLPDNENMRKYFNDQFVIWHPKDIVGGDIYLFNELRHKDECLIMVIDCTGHGVPGAFVTMLVKAVEVQLMGEIANDKDMDISPAWIMSYFNRSLKRLLKQETKDSISNAGFDGGIIYYNRREKVVKFAGAETPLFYVDTKGELHTVKGNRYSVGYKKCDMDYAYKESIIEVEEGMKFYCTTDGYLDQNGGEKDFPFGKKRFANIIKEYHKEPMADQQEMFLYTMAEYENAIPNNDRNDDMTIIGFEIGDQTIAKEDEIKEIFKYEGVITQNVIATAMDNIEVKITNMGTMGTISTITVEYCQNMMNYSKSEDSNSTDIVPAGEIEVKYINGDYKIIATNIISVDDKEVIEPKLKEIQSLDRAGIKKRYRELRKSGANTHSKGGGIGMYEIAKISDAIEYSFKTINENRLYFTMSSLVKKKEKKC